MPAPHPSPSFCKPACLWGCLAVLAHVLSWPLSQACDPCWLRAASLPQPANWTSEISPGNEGMMQDSPRIMKRTEAGVSGTHRVSGGWGLQEGQVPPIKAPSRASGCFLYPFEPREDGVTSVAGPLLGLEDAGGEKGGVESGPPCSAGKGPLRDPRWGTFVDDVPRMGAECRCPIVQEAAGEVLAS